MTKHAVLTSRYLLSTWLLVAACSSPKKPAAQRAPDDTVHAKAPTEDATQQGQDASPAIVLAPATPLRNAPLGLPASPSPAYNPSTPEKLALGALLFADSRLSQGEFACVTCHQREHGWANPALINDTAAGKLNLRHTPSLLNVGYHTEFYWDGREQPLEALIIGHWKGQLNIAPEQATEALSTDPLYHAHFQRAFLGKASSNRAAEAIAVYVRSLHSGGSAWDRYEAGESTAVSANAIAGAKLFNSRAGCATCHTPPLYTDLGYHHVGVVDKNVGADRGRSQDPSQAPTFKTPGLRGVMQSPPYFHNGSAATLDEVLTIKMQASKLVLSPLEKKQLLAFLAALSVTES